METIKEVMTAVQEAYKKVFPNSHTYITSSSLGCKDINDKDNFSHCFVNFLGDKASFSNGIEHNDLFRHMFWVNSPADKDGKYTLELGAVGSGFTVKDSSVQYTQCRRVKVPFRKKTNTPEKIVQAMTKHFKKLRETLEAERENIDSKYNRF